MSFEPGCFTPIAEVTYWLRPSTLSAACADVLGAPQAIGPCGALRYLGFFLLTCVLEFPIYVWFSCPGNPWTSRFRRVGLVNLATHPVVFFVAPSFGAAAGYTVAFTLACSEFFAFAVEAMLLKFRYRESWKRSFFASALANLFSWWVGLYFASWLIG